MKEHEKNPSLVEKKWPQKNAALIALTLALISTLACSPFEIMARQHSAEATFEAFLPATATATATITPNPLDCNPVHLGINPEEEVVLSIQHVKDVHLQTRPGDPPRTDIPVLPLSLDPRADCLVGPRENDPEEGGIIIPYWTKGIDLDAPSGKPQTVWQNPNP